MAREGRRAGADHGFNPQSGLTRPLCPYPQYAKYKGTGNLKDAANWACTAPSLNGALGKRRGSSPALTTALRQ